MISVMIPALNEEANLASTIETILLAAKKANNIQLDIIVVNDGSTDKTAAVTKNLEDKYANVRSIHFSQNRGLGAAFRAAIAIAKYPQITTFPGDNCCGEGIMLALFRNCHRAEMLLSYLVNTEERPFKRRLLSALYSYTYIVVFNLPINYMNGSPVYPVKKLKELDLKANRYGIFAETNVKLIRSGVSFMEIPDYVKPNQTKSSALKVRNLLETLSVFFRLVAEIHGFRRQQYSKKSFRVIPGTEDARI